MKIKLNRKETKERKKVKRESMNRKKNFNTKTSLKKALELG
jgi:hypothetical protein